MESISSRLSRIQSHFRCKDMALDKLITSPHRSCSTLLKRHSFLLTALAILACLCTIYLYFAVTLGSIDSCSGLAGAQKVSCQLQHAKASMAHGKLKFF